MDVSGKTAALYGRFSADVRETLSREIVRLGGAISRDLTRRSDLLVVGAHAFPLIDTGRLAARLAAAQAQGAPVYSEREFASTLRHGSEADDATLPLGSIKNLTIAREAILVLAAFDIVRLSGDCCRFSDAAALRTASEFAASGRSLAQIVRILTEARDHAPVGRRKIVLDPRGQGALQWEEGLSRLDGQGYLPLGDDGATIDDLFEAAAAAESEGDLREAERLYEIAARVDKNDPSACYNLGNVRLAAERYGEAALAFRQAIARDPKFAEARYNLATASERAGKPDLARDQLLEALAVDPGYADARFNLAQLELKRGALTEARRHFEFYLAGGPPADWAEKARRAIQYCNAAISA